MEKNKLRVIHVLPSLGRGGAERLVLDFVETSQKLFPEVESCVVVLSEKDEYSSEYPTVKIKKIITTCPISLTGRSKPDIIEFNTFVDNYQPNIIHSHVYFADLVCHFRLLSHVKYVSHIHGRTKQLEPFPIHGWSSKESYTNEIERRFITKQFKKAKTHFIAITEYQKKEYFSKLKFIPATIDTIPNAINLNRFKKHNSKESIDKLRLINSGRMQLVKNQIFLVDVVKEIFDKGIEVELIILGDGEERLNITKRIKELELESKIKLLGVQPNPEFYLNEADIFIHSATIEPFGLALIESIACGTPVVFTDGKGNSELFKNAGVGTIIWDNSPETMANEIISLFRDKKRYLEEQNKGIEFAKSFGIEEFSKQLIDYYLRLF